MTSTNRCAVQYDRSFELCLLIKFLNNTSHLVQIVNPNRILKVLSFLGGSSVLAVFMSIECIVTIRQDTISGTTILLLLTVRNVRRIVE